MYKPKYLPNLIELGKDFKGVKYGVSYHEKPVNPSSPETEPLHLHGYLEVFFNLSDDVSFLLTNSVYEVKRGEMFLSKPNEVHMCLYKSACVHKHFCLWVSVSDDSELLSFANRSDFKPLYSFSPEQKEELKSLFYKLDELSKTSEKDELETATALFQILNTISLSTGRDIKETSVPKQFQSVLDFVKENSSTITGVGEISKKFYVSVPTLNRWFKKYLRLSPAKYLEGLKLANAKKLLLGGSSVTEACYGSGFNDCSHFIALFKSRFKVTPNKFKKTK